MTESRLTAEEASQVRRMLEAFKAGLPRHDVSTWGVTSKPLSRFIEETRPHRVVNTAYEGLDVVTVTADGECSRCGRRFRGTKNLVLTEHLSDGVLKAKQEALQSADRDGACWGDVPSDPAIERGRVFATLDGALA